MKKQDFIFIACCLVFFGLFFFVKPLRDWFLDYSKFTDRWGERRWIVGFYNAYSRKNPFYVDVEADFYGNLAYKQYSLFPIIPSVSYQFKF